MKKIMLVAAACTLMIAGCTNDSEEKVASLQAQVTTLEASLKHTNARNETLQDQLTELDSQLHEAKSQADDLRLELQRAPEAVDADELGRLNNRIKQLEAEIETLKSTPTTPPAEPVEPTEAVAPEPAPDPEVRKKLDDLLPLIKAETDTNSLDSALGLLGSSDKQTRDDYIAKIRQWVKDEPQNKRARLALALTLTTRFRDLDGQMMKQAALAGEVSDEVNQALKIDPEFYEAVHFLAILKVNYPPFTPEFKEANVALDHALELQENQTWEEDFADIYSAYSKWYRIQKKLDEAAAIVQAGLDRAPRNQGLLNEQQAIEDARNPEGE